MFIVEKAPMHRVSQSRLTYSMVTHSPQVSEVYCNRDCPSLSCVCPGSRWAALRDSGWQGINSQGGDGKASLVEPRDGSEGFDLKEAHAVFIHMPLAKTHHMAKPGVARVNPFSGMESAFSEQYDALPKSILGFFS